MQSGVMPCTGKFEGLAGHLDRHGKAAIQQCAICESSEQKKTQQNNTTIEYINQKNCSRFVPIWAKEKAACAAFPWIVDQ